MRPNLQFLRLLCWSESSLNHAQFVYIFPVGNMLLKSLFLLFWISQALACLRPFGFPEPEKAKHCGYCKDCVKDKDLNDSLDSHSSVTTTIEKVSWNCFKVMPIIQHINYIYVISQSAFGDYLRGLRREARFASWHQDYIIQSIYNQ